MGRATKNFWQVINVVNTDQGGSIEFDLYLKKSPISKGKFAIKYWTPRPGTALV